MLIFYHLLPLLLSAYCSLSRSWHIIIVVCVLDFSPCHQSCHCRSLVVVAVLLLLAAVSLIVDASVGFCASSLAAESPQSKLTYHFLNKFQQVIGTNKKVFERVKKIFFSKQVPGLSKRCTFALANGLAG